MKHPSEANLALYAGQDLGWLPRRRTARHLAGCGQCRNLVAQFSELQSEVKALNELPGVSWNRLAAEMKANIRLGLAAGECVRDSQAASLAPSRSLAGGRAILAYALATLLIVAGVWIERPTPPITAEPEEAILVQNGEQGIELKEGGQTLKLVHGRAENVTFTVGAQGAMRARYVDSNTGYVTINSVYVQ